MSGFLNDTNCISKLVRPRPEPRVVEWMEATDETILNLSVLTVGHCGSLGLDRGRVKAQGKDLVGHAARHQRLG